MLDGARQGMARQRKLFKDRRKEIEFKPKEIQQRKFLEIEEKERKWIKEIKSYTINIIEWGLWQTNPKGRQSSVDVERWQRQNKCPKGPIEVHKKVLHQGGNNKVFIFQKVVNGKRVSLSVQEL